MGFYMGLSGIGDFNKGLLDDFMVIFWDFMVILIGIELIEATKHEGFRDLEAMALLDRSLTELWFGGDVP